MSFVTQWTRNGVNIDGATAATYVIGSADLGKTLAFKVTAINDAGSTTAVSNGVFVPQTGSSPVISGTPPTSVIVGGAYSFTPGVTGGQTPFVFSISAGSLPGGLSLNTSTGAITGTATTAQVKTGIVETVTDANGAQSSLSPWDITVFASGTPVTPSTWFAALQAAAPGAVLVMSAENFGNIDISSINKAAPGVTLQGQSGTTLTYISVNNCSGLIFTGIPFTGLRTGQYGVSSFNSSRITFDSLTTTGNNPGATHSGVGVFVRDSDHITVTNNNLSQLGAGVTGLDCTNIVCSGNIVSKISANPILWLSTKGLTIEQNKVGPLEFVEVGTHSNYIHVAPTGSTGNSTNVVVRYNNCEQPPGVASNGFIIGFEGCDTVTCDTNCGFDSGANGITASACTNVAINNNFMQGYTGSPRIYCRDACNIVSMTNNFCTILPFSLAGTPPNQNVTISGNTLIPLATSVSDTTRRNAFLAANPQIPV